MGNKLSCDVTLHYVTVEMLYLDNHSQCYGTPSELLELVSLR